MKKSGKMRIATIACWCVVAVAMAGLAVWALTGSLFGLPTGFKLSGLSIGGIESLTGKYELIETRTMQAAGIDSLDINWVAGGITVTPYDGAEIEFAEYAQRDLSDRERMCITASNGTVYVRYIEDSRVSKMPPKQLEVRVPRELCGNIEMLDADSTSADISVTGITATKLTAGSTSGDIELFDIHAVELNADSTSGEIKINRVECGSMTLGSTSGNLKTTDSSADTLNTSTTSGEQKLYGDFFDMDLDGISGNITVENSAATIKLRISTTSGEQNVSGAFSSVICGSISGNMRVVSTTVPGELNIDTTSGDVTITIPKEDRITLNHSTVSGSLKNDIPMLLGEGSDAFEISTISGDVRIYEMP